jgi:DNA-binding MarR family transcriptional regulator
MTPDLQALATLDRVIHEPARLMIMTVLYTVNEADFLYLQRECGLTQGNLSSHLAKLEDAHYVLIDKMFKGKYPLTVCSLTQKGRAAFAEYVQKIRVVSDPASNESQTSTKGRSSKSSI